MRIKTFKTSETQEMYIENVVDRQNNKSFNVISWNGNETFGFWCFVVFWAWSQFASGGKSRLRKNSSWFVLSYLPATIDKERKIWTMTKNTSSILIQCLSDDQSWGSHVCTVRGSLTNWAQHTRAGQTQTHTHISSPNPFIVLENDWF